MTAADAPLPLTRGNPIGRLTDALFGWLPISLALLALRFAVAVPFWKSGMTKWVGFLTLSFGAQQLFVDEFKLHLFGGAHAFPFPETMAPLSALGEAILPALLVFGLATRYAALGILAMTAIIQLTVPDGWANFHLPWAAMALSIMTFGPGRIALDRLLGVERASV